MHSSESRPRIQARRRRLVLALAVLTAAATSVGTAAAQAAPAPAAAPAARSVTQPDLGPNVIVFDPSMSVEQIKSQVDAVANQQLTNQFGTARYALLFKPGTYGTPAHPLNFQVGYYTEVAGLGLSPSDVLVNGSVDVYN